MPLTHPVYLQMNFLVFLGSSLYFLVPFKSILHYYVYPHNSFISILYSFRTFTIAFLKFVSVILQGSISLFPPSKEFCCSFNWEWFLIFFNLFIFFLFCKEATTVVWMAIYMWECPWVICEVLHFILFYFFLSGLLLVWMLALSSLCAGCYPLDIVCSGVWPVHAFRKMEAMGRVRSQCLFTVPLTLVRTHRSWCSCSCLQGPGKWHNSQAGLGRTQGLWQWQQQGLRIFRGVRERIGGAQFQCPPLQLSLKWLGPQVVLVPKCLVIASHNHLWSQRYLWWFSPTTYRSPCTRHPDTCSPCKR